MKNPTPPTFTPTSPVSDDINAMFDYAGALNDYSQRYPGLKRFFLHGSWVAVVISIIGILTPGHTITVTAAIISFTSGIVHGLLLWWTGRDLTKARRILDALKDALDRVEERRIEASAKNDN